MEIYIGNIPKGTRAAELRRLLKDSVKDSVFKRLFEKAVDLGRFDKGIEVDIHQFKRQRRKNYRYGHINISSDRIAEVALDALQKHGKIRGKPLEVRPFVERNDANDRRSGDTPNTWTKKSRRKQDRRRKH